MFKKKNKYLILNARARKYKLISSHDIDYSISITIINISIIESQHYSTIVLYLYCSNIKVLAVGGFDLKLCY